MNSIAKNKHLNNALGIMLILVALAVLAYTFVYHGYQSIEMILLNLWNRAGADPSYITDIGVFSGVVLGVAIPLSWGMIARLNEHFDSDVVNNIFAQHWLVLCLPYLLAVNITAAIALRFLGTSFSSGPGKLLGCALICSYSISVVLFLNWIRVLCLHAKSDYLLEILMAQVESNRTTEERVYTYVGLGDLLVSETKRKSQLRVVMYLKRLNVTLSKYDFHDLDSNPNWIVVNTFMNQLLRILEISEEKNADDVTQAVCAQLVGLVAVLVEQPGNSTKVRWLTEVIQGLYLRAIQKGHKQTAQSLTTWFSDVCFCRNIVPDYISNLIGAFLNTALGAITYEDHQAFQRMIRRLSESLIDSEWPMHQISEWGHFLLRENQVDLFRQLNSDHNYDDRVLKLHKSPLSNGIVDVVALNNEILSLSEIQEAVMTSELQMRAASLSRAVILAINRWHLRQSVMEGLFSLGANCWKTGKLEYIRALLELKTESGGLVTLIGPSLIPESLPELINIWLKDEPIDRRFSWIFAHIFDEHYFHQQFAAIFAHLWQRQFVDRTMRIDVSKLSDNAINQLSNDARILSTYSKAISEDPVKLQKLGLPVNLDWHSALNTLLINAVVSCWIERRKRITARVLDSNSVSSFYNAVITGYEKQSTIRNVLIKCCVFGECVDSPAIETHKWTLQKQAFSLDNRFELTDAASMIGKEVATKQEQSITKMLLGSCKSISLSEFDKLPTRSSFIALISSFNTLEINEKLKRTSENTTNDSKFNSTPGFLGVFTIGGADIPVFTCAVESLEGMILLINRMTFGSYNQKAAPTEHYGRSQIGISLMDLSKDDDLRRGLAANDENPDYKQDFLSDQVFVRVGYAWEFKQGAKFEGYFCTDLF